MDYTQRRKDYKTHVLEAIGEDDLANVCRLAIYSLGKLHGSTAKYADSESGLEQFKDRCLGYFEFVQQANTEAERKLIPDIEGLCLYLGVSRATLCNYRKRGDTWHDAIELVSLAILACKKQLMLTGRIPPIVGIFDLTNNHQYVNSSEFHLVPEAEQARPILSGIENEQMRKRYTEALTVTENKNDSLPDCSDELK